MRMELAGLGEPRVGALEGDTVEGLIDVPATARKRPREVFLAVWVGYGDQSQRLFPGAAHLPTPDRGTSWRQGR